MASGSGGHTLA